MIDAVLKYLIKEVALNQNVEFQIALRATYEMHRLKAYFFYFGVEKLSKFQALIFTLYQVGRSRVSAYEHIFRYLYDLGMEAFHIELVICFFRGFKIKHLKLVFLRLTTN